MKCRIFHILCLLWDAFFLFRSWLTLCGLPWFFHPNLFELFELSCSIVQYYFPEINYSLKLNSLQLDPAVYDANQSRLKKTKNKKTLKSDFSYDKYNLSLGKLALKVFMLLFINVLNLCLFFFFFLPHFYLFISDFRFCPGFRKHSSWIVCVWTWKSWRLGQQTTPCLDQNCSNRGRGHLLYAISYLYNGKRTTLLDHL